MNLLIYTVYTRISLSINQAGRQAFLFLCSSQMVYSPNGTFAKWFIRQIKWYIRQMAHTPFCMISLQSCKVLYSILGSQNSNSKSFGAQFPSKSRLGQLWTLYLTRSASK
jgi:hypothetical protein